MTTKETTDAQEAWRTLANCLDSKIVANFKASLRKKIENIYSSNKGKEVAFSEERLKELLDTCLPIKP